jgi:hypothetical protein
VISAQFRAEVNAFLQVGFARSQLPADWKISSPGFAAFSHADLELGFEVLSKEPAAVILKAKLKFVIDSVPDNVEEADFSTRKPDLPGHLVSSGRSGQKGADVDDWKWRRLAHGATLGSCSEYELRGSKHTGDDKAASKRDQVDFGGAGLRYDDMADATFCQLLSTDGSNRH